MANYEKFTRNGTANLFAHFDRTLKNNSNKDIKPEQTHLNYNLAPDKISSPNEILKNRLTQVKVLRRKDVNVLCSWVVTLPKDFNGDEKAFFQATYDFLEKKYGAKNVVSAWVHKDETTPHMHFAFIPVVIDRNKQIEKVSAKECVTKYDLMTFHSELQNHIENTLHREVHILNGATKDGNLTVRELKCEQKEKNIEERENSLSERENELLERLDKVEQEKVRLEKKSANLAVLEQEANDFVANLETPKNLPDISNQSSFSTPERLEWNFKPQDKNFHKEPRGEYAFRVVQKIYDYCKSAMNKAIEKFTKAKSLCKDLALALGEKEIELRNEKAKLRHWTQMTPEDGFATFQEIKNVRTLTNGKVQNWDDYKEWQNEQKQKRHQRSHKSKNQDFGIGY